MILDYLLQQPLEYTVKTQNGTILKKETGTLFWNENIKKYVFLYGQVEVYIKLDTAENINVIETGGYAEITYKSSIIELRTKNNINDVIDSLYVALSEDPERQINIYEETSGSANTYIGTVGYTIFEGDALSIDNGTHYLSIDLSKIVSIDMEYNTDKLVYKIVLENEVNYEIGFMI